MTDEKPYTQEPGVVTMTDLVAGWRAMDKRVQELEERANIHGNWLTELNTMLSNHKTRLMELEDNSDCPG